MLRDARVKTYNPHHIYIYIYTLDIKVHNPIKLF